MLTKIIYKNFRSNLKNYILFFLSNIVAIMELFVFYGIRSIIKNSITDKVTAEALKTDFQIAVGIIAVITLMLMFYAMKCYIKLRIKDYSMFLILGMKKKAVSLLLLFEYCIGCVISLILGIGTGRILLYIIQRLLVKYYPQYIRMYVLRYQIYKNVCLGSISIMILVFVVLLIWLDGRSLGMLMAEDKKNEKRPISYMWIILAVIGIVLMMAGIILYCGSDTQYLYAHGVLLMGLILAVVFGLALFLNLLKKCKNFYYRYMLDLNQLYSRYLNHMILLILLIVVHFFSLSYLVVQTAELLPLDQYRNQYPYDMIWITEKGNKEYAKKLASTYNGTLTEVPMMRVSTYYGANHIGISEKTYRKLSKSPALNLKENMKVRVALIDSGVKSKLYNERFQTYIDEGYEIVVNREKNFLQINESNFEDYNGHGTACAFTIKELAPDISIIPIKILGNDGRGNIEQLIAALELLDELDVQVVNMSISSNIKNLEDRLEPIIRKLIKRGIVCIAAESNYRNTSIPAEMDNVIGTRGSWAIYGSKFQYCRNKSIQILGSGAPELVDSEIGFSTFFKGNSKATAIITGIIANQMCVQGGFNQNIEDFLQSKSCEEKELYSSIDFKCLNYELNKIVFNILNELEKKGQINVIIKKEGLLDFSRSNIKDFYTIIKELEKIFACKIMGKTKVYKSYFESLNNLAKLVEVSKQ